MSRKVYCRIWRFILRVLFALFFVTPRFVGLQKLRALRGPFLLASNHISNLDPPLLRLLPGQFNFMAKKELLSVPVLGWCMTKSGEIPLNRGVPDSASIRAAMSRIAAGEGVAVFPEGTRSVDGRLSRGKAGVGMLAMMARVPVLPVAIHGADRILPKGHLVPRLADITIRVGDPVPLEDLFARVPADRAEEKEIYQLVADRVMDAIAALLGVPSPTPAPGAEPRAIEADADGPGAPPPDAAARPPEG